MRVLIIGGTGLLGYHAALEFLRRGHAVETVASSDTPPGDWFPRQVRVRKADVFKLDRRQCRRLFEGCDAMVYAVGPDDRVTPAAPAYDFFRERLVDACGRIVGAAREAGVERCVVLGSYYTHFERKWPHKRLALHHPYVRCRVEQAARAFDEGGSTMRVSVLELPYIFGVLPEREPLWKGVLLERLRRMPVILYPQGGSAMTTAAHVGEAVVGAAERGRHGASYPIGDENLTWDEMLGVMLQTLGIDKPIRHIPRFLGALFGRGQRKADARRGRESGLDYEWLFRDVMTDYFYIDAAPSVKALRYGHGGVREAIAETVRASYPERFREAAAR